MFTPKQRMLNAYRGIYSDRIPVAPEFWVYYPARVLGVNMIEFEREIPHWKALLETFKKYDCEGWGCVSAGRSVPGVEKSSEFKQIDQGRFRNTDISKYKGHVFESTTIHTYDETSWRESYPVKDENELPAYLDMCLEEGGDYNFQQANKAYDAVGEDYLLELAIGSQFFDFIAQSMGFQETILYFLSGNDDVLQDYFNRYVEQQKRFIKEASEKSRFESFFIGCSFSCNSLEGPALWRKWDKPYIRAVVDEAHKYGKLVHIHLHGRIMETVRDLPELGLDCVCPFESDPGDVNGSEDLKAVRKVISGKVTFNGNVNTVRTLIRGTPEDVRREVREIMEAFQGTPRLIVGTGDQVGGETPEENIMAMIDEVKSNKNK